MKISECKIELLKHGVNFSPIDLFNGVDDKVYKLKYLNKKPVTNMKQVFDVSEQRDMIPAEVVLEKDGNKSLTKLRYNPSSPLSLQFSDGKLTLLAEGKKANVDLSLVKYNGILSEKLPEEVSDKGFTIGDYVSVVGLNRVTIHLYDGCHNWLCGKNCKFCDLHPVRKDSVSAKPTINDLYKFTGVRQWWESQREHYIKCLQYSLKKVLDSFKPDEECFIFFMAGNLANTKQVWKVADDIVSALSKVVDLSKYTNYLNIAPHDSLENLEKMKGYGINNVQYNLEVSSKELFEDYCPGKVGYDTFVSKLVEAVSVLGKGHVRSNFVLGLEDMNTLLNFADEMGEKGVVVDYSVFQPKKGTQLADHPSPEFNDVVDFSKKLVDVYKKYDQKPIFSTTSSRSSVMNELFLDI